VFQRKFAQNARPAAFAAMFARLAAFLAVALALSASPAAANSNYAGIVIDAKTGKTLYAVDADELRYPASLTKMMTLYMTFEAIKAGKIRLDTRVKMSANAAAEQPSKLGLKAGQTLTVEQAILAIVTRSANDVATAMGELLGGSEAKFASMMTARARSLGMSRTTFRNAHGLPNSAQVTTARDMAKLGIALREHFPREYKYFSTRSFTFGKSRIGNHNRLLGTVRGVDGIKTGYTRASGFNLVSSVVDRDRSIVAVVLGGKTGASRNEQMKKLIAAYLPKASRRGGGQLIVKGAPSASFAVAAAASSFRLPVVGPVPAAREDGTPRLALAYAAAPVVGRQALVETLRQQKVAIPTPAPAVIPPAPIEAATPAAEIDPVTTASTSPVSGWVIQIGAMPEQDAAIGLLTKAKTVGGAALANAEPFTVAFAKGNSQLYRARFGGFDGQSSALSACKALERKGFACWATQN